MPSRWSLTAILLTALTLTTHAGTLEAPKLQAGRFVYTIPAGFIPERLSVKGLEEIQGTAKGLHYPFYVVFVKDLPTRTGSSTDEDAERAIVGLADDWARDPVFNRNRSTLFLVSYGPGDRKYRMLPAPLWRVELGLENDALVPYTSIFRQYARQDPQTAVTRMLTAFDTHVFDNYDPKRKAERAEQMRLRAAQQRIDTARARVSTEAFRLKALLDSEPDKLPKDVASYRTLLETAQSVENTKDPVALEVMASDLSQNAGELQEYVALRNAEESTRRFKLFLILMAVGIAAAGSIVFAAKRLRFLEAQRTELGELLQTWRGWIQQARQRYYLFDENRDRAPHLKQFQGKTKEIYESTSKEIDSIIIGVEAIAAHLDTIEAKAKKASFLNVAPANEALATADQPFSFDTEKISDKLFEPETQWIKVKPSTFFGDLSSRYDAAIRNWQELNESVTESLQLPDALFPHAKLDELLATCHEKQIPERWLNKHPLIGDASSDQTLYGKVNECRITDPYAYALQIRELKGKEEETTSDLTRLQAALELADSHRREAVTGLAETFLSPEDNPQITLDEANQQRSRLLSMLSTAETVEAMEDQAVKVDDLYMKASQQLEAAKLAIEKAADVGVQARSELASAKEFVARVSQRLAEVAREHRDVSAVENASSAAAQFVESAARDLARAESKLQEKRHLGAYRDAQTAQNQLAQATEKLNAALDICVDLDAVKARYEEQVEAMQKAEEDARRRVRRFDGSADLIRSFHRPQVGMGLGPMDYAYLYGMLQQQQQEWNRIARQTEMAYEEEQRRQREAAEAERRRHQASLYNSSSSSSSSWGGGGSSSSGSSGGSFSSGGSGSSGGSW
ncbi:MAG: hypothetical protein ACAH95_06520 [Fimbriimonas sp.]